MDTGTPPIGIETLMQGDKFAFEKIGNDGEMHETDCYGAFLDTAPTPDNVVALTCVTCKWNPDCNAAGGLCESYE